MAVNVTEKDKTLNETKQTKNAKQHSRRETDTSEHPVIRFEPNELVEMICDAYRNGLSDKEQS